MRNPMPSPPTAAAAALALLGCAASGSNFEQLPATDRSLFRRCSEPIAAQLCPAEGEGARRVCLDARAEIFADRPTTKLRRRWLALNGCPASVIEAPDEPEAAVAAAPAPAPAEAPVPAPVETPVLAATEPPPLPPTLAPSEPDRPAPPPQEPVVPAPPVLATGDLKLREAIVAHQDQMKSCVERQLKLLPTLRAEGTLVIEVDSSGGVTRARLRGEDLEGTSLEECLRTLALRWRFPRTARAYAIEAPVKVSGTD
jgi:hypothetical protein